ncbi:MAG: hypothetical protein ABFR19_00440 [Pseudomonadota bacterium]
MNRRDSHEATESMSESPDRDAGMLLVVVEQFRKGKLSRLMALKEQVDNGNVLNEADVEFLHKVIDDAHQTMPSTVNNAGLQEFCGHVVHLCNEIIEKAFENENKQA